MLTTIKLLHTVVWAFFVACIAGIFAAAQAGRFGLACLFIGVVLLEVLILFLNRMRCPLTGIAARYTPLRAENFDIFLPLWLARNNQRIFGTLYVLGIAFTLFAWLGRRDAPTAEADSAASMATSAAPSLAGERPTTSSAENSQGFLYGRIDTVDGATFEGRLRWGGGEEAFWDDAFNGTRKENPWLAQVPPAERPIESDPLEVFGVVLARRERPSEVKRPFVAPFGAISRIEARGGEVRVTLKGGSVIDLDRFESSDFDDGLRVWDARGQATDLDSLRIRQVDLLATPALGGLACRLSGVVRSRAGEFRGFVAWNRDAALGSDELTGRSGGERLRLRLADVRALARTGRDGLLVTLRDGRELPFEASSGSDGRRGLTVSDGRYGRVRVAWEVFDRVDFDAPADPAACASGPAYDEIEPQPPLRGTVTARDGTRPAGRLIFDLDESTEADTLDAGAEGIEYALPFGKVAAIVLPPVGENGAGSAGVVLGDGSELRLDRTGDLAAANAGLLVYVEGDDAPAYLPWAKVARLDFEPRTTSPGPEAR